MKQLVGIVGSTSSAYSTVAATTTSATLLAVNANRAGATIFNASSATLYLKLGAGASTSSFTIPMNSGGYLEVPYAYGGVITGVWASADPSGFAAITEVS